MFYRLTVVSSLFDALLNLCSLWPSWFLRTGIKNVATYVSRLGQGFSTSMETVSIEVHDFTIIPDITRNGYCFSDGIGKMTPDLAEEVDPCWPVWTVPHVASKFGSLFPVYACGYFPGADNHCLEAAGRPWFMLCFAQLSNKNQIQLMSAK